MKQEDLSKLEKTIEYYFKSKDYLKQAMIHSSYSNEHHIDKLKNNERLEFLGDAVLEIVISEFLFHTYKEKPEGELT